MYEPQLSVEKRHVELWTIAPGDQKRPPPLRSVWLRAVRQVDYRDRLGAVQASVLLMVGRHDPQTPLAAGLPAARLLIFEKSGHSPFLEEPERFYSEIAALLE
jgi:proline iminopeptidase